MPVTNLQTYTGNKDQAQEAFLYGLQGIPLAAAGLLAPQVALGRDPTDFTNYIPGKGLATSMYAGVTGLADLGMNYVGKPAAQFLQNLSPNFASVTPTIPDTPVHIPGGEAARTATEEAIKGSLATIPHAEATTEAAKLGQDIGIGLTEGAMNVVPPGVGMLPKAASTALRLMLPPAKTAGIGAALGGVSGAIASPLGEDHPPFTPYEPPTDKKDELPAFTPYAPPATTPSVLPQPTSDNDSGTSYLVRGLELAAGATLAWGAAKYGPRTLNVVSDLLRGQTRNVAEANTILSRGLPGANSLDMPLPNDASGLSRRLATQWANPNAVVNEFVKSPQVSPTPDIAALKKASNDAVNNPGFSNRRMESLFRTGVEEGSGHTFPKIVDFKHASEGLNEAQYGAANDAAWFKNELNNRYANMRSGMPEPEARVSYPQWDTTTLEHRVAQAEADPQVKAWLDLKKQFTDSLIDSAEVRGHITKQEASHARGVYGDFMPTIGREGEYLHSWEGRIRDPGSGHADHPADATQAIINHFDRTIRDMQKNEWRRNIILDWKRLQDADPTLPQFIKETDYPSGVRNSLSVRTATGPRHFDIHNTPFFDNLTTNPQSMNLASGIANTMRSFYTNATTGLLNTVAGSAYAPVNMMIDTLLVPSQASKNLYRGSIERAIGRQLPFYDPTFPINVGQTLVKDTASTIVKNLGDILGNRYNAIAAPLRAAFGHDQVDAWVAWLRHQHELTDLGFREGRGVSGGGNRAMVDLRSPVTDKYGTYRDPTSNAVSPMMNTPKFDEFMKRIPLPNFLRLTASGVAKGSAESFINLYALVKDLYNVIHDAPHSALFDLNKANPKIPSMRVLANEVQHVTGDPATQGTGGLSRSLTRGMPWYNTSIQGMGAHLAAVRDRPIATGMSIAGPLLMLSLASHLSALLSGPEHVKDFEDKVTNSAKARGHIFYHGPGTDPNNHTEFPTPPEWRVWAPYIDGIVGHMMGTWNAHSDADTLSRTIHTLTGPFDQHVTTDTDIQTAIGGLSGFMPVDMPPALGATVAAATGQAPKNIPEQLATNAMTGQPWLSNMTTGGGFLHKTPGQEGTDGVLTRADAGTFKAVASALGAAIGTAYDMTNNFSARQRIDPTWEWAWRGLGEDYKQQWQDHTKYLNTVWQNNLPQSSYGSLEERTNRMHRNVQETANYNTDVRGEGFSKTTRGIPLTVTADTPVPKDPQMLKLYTTTSEYAKAINREIMPKENEIRAQIDNVRKGAMMPEEKRRLGNKLSEELYQVTTQKHAMLLNLNARLSQLADGRHVDVGKKINWQGTIDQFHH